MSKGSSFWVLGAAGAACLAIAIGVFTNNGDDLLPLEPMVSELVVTADVDPAREGWSEPRMVAAESHSETVETPAAEEAAIEAVVADESKADEGTEVATSEIESLTPDEQLAVARQAFAQRDWARVITHLQGTPSEAHFDAHYLLGLALRYEGRAEESVAAMDAALNLRPNSVRALTNCARALLEMRDLARAEERVRRSVELAPEDAGAWNVLGRVHLSNDALPEAEDAFSRVLEIEPEHGWALNNLGFARLQRGAWQEAADVLELAVAAQDDVAVFHNNLGVAYERLSRLSDAQREFARALTLNSDYGKAEVSLARVTDSIAAGALDVAAATAVSAETEQEPEMAANATSVETQEEDESSVQP